MSAASSAELEQDPAEQTQPDEIIYTSYKSLLKKLQQIDSASDSYLNQIGELALKWKRATRAKRDTPATDDTKATFVGDDGPTVAYKSFIWGLLTNIIENIKLKSSLYNMELMSKIISFFAAWEEDGYPGIVVINKDGIDSEIYKEYYAILLTMYESRGKSGFEKLIDPSIFVNANGSLNLGNTPLMAMLRDLIRGCKRGAECIRGNKDHLTFMHRLPVSPDIRTIYGYSSAYPVKGGKRRTTQYRKKTKSSNRKTQKKSRKQRS